MGGDGKRGERGKRGGKRGEEGRTPEGDTQRRQRGGSWDGVGGAEEREEKSHTPAPVS